MEARVIIEAALECRESSLRDGEKHRKQAKGFNGNNQICLIDSFKLKQKRLENCMSTPTCSEILLGII